jgi:gamma-glutamylcyclotransferase (GGCT)/AIG2-like uncharacterized protein YtfP
MSADCPLLFVYGTLRRASRHPMAAYLAERGRSLGEAKLAARLYNLGRYPGITPPRDADDWVYGDLYDLGDDGEALAELDRYENAESPQPAFFDRQLATVTLGDGQERTAWVYWFRGEVDEGRRIASGQYEA